MQAALGNNPAPWAVAAKLLEGWDRRVRLHALEDGAIRLGGTATRTSRSFVAQARTIG
jgi:hypothetical protein